MAHQALENVPLQLPRKCASTTPSKMCLYNSLENVPLRQLPRKCASQTTPSKMCLYNSYVMSYFTYCSAIWHNCSESDNQKLERLNARALRCVYNKRRAPPFSNDDHGSTLSNRRLQDIAILIFKAVNGMLPEYISDLFVVLNNVKNLRGTNKLVVPRKKSTNFGLKQKSTSFIGAKVWNSLPDELRSTKILKEFKNAVRELHL